MRNNLNLAEKWNGSVVCILSSAGLEDRGIFQLPNTQIQTQVLYAYSPGLWETEGFCQLLKSGFTSRRRRSQGKNCSRW